MPFTRPKSGRNNGETSLQKGLSFRNERQYGKPQTLKVNVKRGGWNRNKIGGKNNARDAIAKGQLLICGEAFE
jgi:hypothetical protein